MIFLLAIFFIILELAFGSWIIQMNINDIIVAGEATFWPVFWILAVLVALIGTGSAASK